MATPPKKKIYTIEEILKKIKSTSLPNYIAVFGKDGGFYSVPGRTMSRQYLATRYPEQYIGCFANNWPMNLVALVTAGEMTHDDAKALFINKPVDVKKSNKCLMCGQSVAGKK